MHHGIYLLVIPSFISEEEAKAVQGRKEVDEQEEPFFETALRSTFSSSL